MVNKHMKRCSTYMPLGNTNLKQRDTTTYLLVWLKPKTEEIILVASENVKQEGLSFLLVGMQKCCSHLGK